MPDQARAPTRTRRPKGTELLEHDPAVAWLLAGACNEQQALLRAARYPDWFSLRKVHVTEATRKLRDRRHGERAPAEARYREPCRIWAVISFAIETAMRRGEIAKLDWTHVHWEAGYLQLPGSITKNGKDRIVPLTLRAQRILATRPGYKESLALWSPRGSFCPVTAAARHGARESI